MNGQQLSLKFYSSQDTTLIYFEQLQIRFVSIMLMF